MSNFATNNPLVRKMQQQAIKKISQVATDQMAKNGPKVMDAGRRAIKGFGEGLASPTPPMPTKAGGVADFAGQVGGAVAQDKYITPVKKDLEKKANATMNQVGQKTSQASANVSNKINTITKPFSAKPSSGGTPQASQASVQKPVQKPTTSTGNRPSTPVMSTMKPMKPMTPMMKPTANSVKLPANFGTKNASMKDIKSQMSKITGQKKETE